MVPAPGLLIINIVNYTQSKWKGKRSQMYSSQVSWKEIQWSWVHTLFHVRLVAVVIRLDSPDIVTGSPKVLGSGISGARATD